MRWNIRVAERLFVSLMLLAAFIVLGISAYNELTGPTTCNETRGVWIQSSKGYICLYEIEMEQD